MKNYYEVLAYADRGDLLVEKANKTYYLGFKCGDSSKTIFSIDATERPDESDYNDDTTYTFLTELKETKYESSNLYKKAAEMYLNAFADYLICNNSLNNENEIEVLTFYMRKFSAGITEELKDKIYNNSSAKLKYINDEFVSKMYLDIKSSLELILSTNKMHFNKDNFDLMKKCMPNTCTMINDVNTDAVDWLINEGELVYLYEKSSECLYGSYTIYEDLSCKHAELYERIKRKEIAVTFESEEIKEKILNYIFFSLFPSASHGLSYYGSLDLNNDSRNYYDLFHDGKVTDVE